MESTYLKPKLYQFFDEVKNGEFFHVHLPVL